MKTGLLPQLLMNKNEQGFTLIEMMVSLCIFGIIISLTITLSDRLFVQAQEDLFLKQFHEDVLFMQQETMTKQQRYKLVFFTSKGEYKLYTNGNSEVVLTRSIPHRWSIQLRTLKKPLEFQMDGQTVHPGKIAFLSPHNTFVVTFPFGKARFYVTKQ
ncbi:competence type IV pilus minor pilin ComGD [Pontibacillus salipaludis]|uniref:competence type IV pilus minor pilin ComGD n=1 Tax=Pontibacillus salipaludis TaxID=1697394 RepID=UPI0031EB5BDC